MIAHPLVSSSPLTSSVTSCWGPDSKPGPPASIMDWFRRHSANSSAQGVMSKMTSAESVGFDLLASGALVQLALRWPVLPQRKQIGAARCFPAGRSGLPREGRGGDLIG